MMLLNLDPILVIVLVIYAFFSFFFTLFRPTFGLFSIIPIIILGFEQSSIIKGGFIGLILFAILLHALVTKETFYINKRVIPLILLVLFFILWIFLRNFLGDEGMYFWLFWSVKRVVVPGLLASSIIFLVRTEREVWIFTYILYASLIISALFGIFQYFTNMDVFWTAREMLGVPASIAYQISDRIRITGLSSFVVPFAYSLLSVLPVAFSLCFTESKCLFIKIMKLLGFAIVSLALFLTFIKAGIGGGIAGLIAVLILLSHSRKLKHGVVIFLFLVAFCFSAFIITDKNISKQVFHLGQTSYERIPIAMAAMKILISNPLGVGYSYGDHVEDIYSDISGYSGAKVSLVQFPHNMILDLGVILGLPALATVLAFYLILFRGLFRVYKFETGNLKILIIGLMGSFVAYLFNAMFHNNNPFFGDTLNWLFIGLVVALINMAYLKTLVEHGKYC